MSVEMDRLIENIELPPKISERENNLRNDSIEQIILLITGNGKHFVKNQTQKVRKEENKFKENLKNLPIPFFYEPLFPSVGWLVGRRPVYHGREVTLPCSFPSTCFIHFLFIQALFLGVLPTLYSAMLLLLL